MRQRLENKLLEIHETLVKMSILVEENVDWSIRALTMQQTKMADEVIENDDLIDSYEEKIEDMCIEFIATQNPLGSDLRRIFTVLKLITDLERIGDHAVNIARITKTIGDETLLEPIDDIKEMAKITRKMIYNSINSYIDQNLDLAMETAAMDDTVDDLYEGVYDELLDIMESKSEFKGQVIGLLLVGRYLERIADHATNICERVGYMITGKRMSY
ncbi:MAG: PhoU family transcriptional regulator [delta proteobacterium ML8_F1]|nr:MAG: PhoU family transcriptional regulator [delta proteobacterium ML8_F1]